MEHLFLFALAIVWVVFASLQDLKKREVANWISFSLLIFGLVYRAIYSIIFEKTSLVFFFYSLIFLLLIFVSAYFIDYLVRKNNKKEYVSAILTCSLLVLLITFDFATNYFHSIFLKAGLEFFYLGVLGLAIFFVVSHALYYARVFAGGDAKLLISLGVIFFISGNIYENIFYSGFFIFLMIFLGAIYSIIYSFFIFFNNRKKAFSELKNQVINNKIFFISYYCFFFIFLMFFYYMNMSLFMIPLFFMPLLFVYAKAFENSCMNSYVNSRELTVGDWLFENVKVGNKIIKPNWEGLDEDELRLLKKYNKQVLVKQGIPFVPAFLFAIILFLILREPFWSLFKNIF